jgi:hypothetical protein
MIEWHNIPQYETRDLDYVFSFIDHYLPNHILLNSQKGYTFLKLK